MSSVISYWSDALQDGLYLFQTFIEAKKIVDDVILYICPLIDHK